MSTTRLTNQDFSRLLRDNKLELSKGGHNGTASKSKSQPSAQLSEAEKSELEEKRKAAKKRKRIEQSKKYYERMKRAKQRKEESQPLSKYRDLAKEIREGRHNSGVPGSSGDGSKVSEQQAKQLGKQWSQYLGGDLEHTHLVKGLDRALLRRMREADGDHRSSLRSQNDSDGERMNNDSDEDDPRTMDLATPITALGTEMAAWMRHERDTQMRRDDKARDRRSRNQFTRVIHSNHNANDSAQLTPFQKQIHRTHYVFRLVDIEQSRRSLKNGQPAWRFGSESRSLLPKTIVKSEGSLPSDNGTQSTIQRDRHALGIGVSNVTYGEQTSNLDNNSDSISQGPWMKCTENLDTLISQCRSQAEMKPAIKEDSEMNLAESIAVDSNSSGLTEKESLPPPTEVSLPTAIPSIFDDVDDDYVCQVTSDEDESSSEETGHQRKRRRVVRFADEIIEHSPLLSTNVDGIDDSTNHNHSAKTLDSSCLTKNKQVGRDIDEFDSFDPSAVRFAGVGLIKKDLKRKKKKSTDKRDANNNGDSMMMDNSRSVTNDRYGLRAMASVMQSGDVMAMHEDFEDDDNDEQSHHSHHTNEHSTSSSKEEWKKIQQMMKDKPRKQ